MLFNTLLLVGTSAIAASATVVTNYLATFSTADTSCGDASGCPPAGYPYYDSLYYSNIEDLRESESENGYCYGFCPHSKPYYGNINPGNTARHVDRALSANYNKSKVLSWHFTSFWAACAPYYRTGTAFNYFPGPCNITVKGYTSPTGLLPSGNAAPIATQTFLYQPTIYQNPDGLSAANFSKFTLSPQFAAVRIVTINAATNNAFPGQIGQVYGPPVLGLDDLEYTVVNATI